MLELSSESGQIAEVVAAHLNEFIFPKWANDSGGWGDSHNGMFDLAAEFQIGPDLKREWLQIAVPIDIAGGTFAPSNDPPQQQADRKSNRHPEFVFMSRPKFPGRRFRCGSYNQGMTTQQKPATFFFRPNNRAPEAMRPVQLTPHYTSMAEGSVLIEVGHTRVLCNATVETGVPGWLKNSGRGWVTAEYGMLPRATLTRTARESERGKVGGRTHEIQRLIGRSLRSVVDMKALGERTVILDCDVLQADGGTRTAAITGACVAMAIAFHRLVDAGTLKKLPLTQLVAATSVGIVEGSTLLDLAYEEDSQADVDMNVVMTESGGLVEVQATAERSAFPREKLLEMMDHAERGIAELIAAQRAALAAR